MNIQELSNAKFLTTFQSKVAEERRLTVEVLHYFREAERRLLHAEYGYSSLLAFAVKELKYSEPAANRRITAMRLLRDVPEVAKKIEAGALTLSSVAQAATFFRQSDKHHSAKMAAEEKREILESIENQSCRQTERVLVELGPELRPPSKEKRRAVAGGGTRVTTVLDAELNAKLEEIQNLLGKKMEFRELVARMADETIKQLRKKREGNPLVPARAAQATSEKGRAIRAHTKRNLWQRARSQCEWINPLSGQRCEERRHLEIDHLTPFALGGGNEIENLQLVCQAHNKLRAVEAFGRKKMSQYLPALRTR
jgi:5-methylcytosine-specific restriction endonuclease McrA